MTTPYDPKLAALQEANKNLEMEIREGFKVEKEILKGASDWSKKIHLTKMLKDRVMNVTRLTDRKFLGKFRVVKTYDSTLKVARLDTGSRQAYYLPNPCCNLSFAHVSENKIRIGRHGETSYMYEYELLGEKA